MKIELLKPDEYGQLEAFPDGIVPNPEHSAAIVAREGQELVGRNFLVSVVHVEGTYVAPKHRCGMTMKQLMDAAEIEGVRCGLTKLFVFAVDSEIEGYLKRLGYTQQPFTVWAKEI